MLIIGRKFEINIQILKEWGEAVSKDLSKRCVSNIRSMGDVAQGIDYIQENLVRVLKQLGDKKLVIHD